MDRFRNDPFARVAGPPTDIDRAHRLRLIVEAVEAWWRGERPSEPARLFVLGALLAWLDQGGDLVGKFLRVRPKRGDRRRPSRIVTLAEGQGCAACPMCGGPVFPDQHLRRDGGDAAS